ncbi:MAG TPA: hypothetical protein VIG51_04095 [Candidatus Baltobacteraceae bacterium]
MRLRRSFVAAAAAFVITLVFSHLRSTPYNNYTLFAYALLHGRLWIDWPGAYIDAVLWHGHRYIVNDPLPGFFMLPLVAIFGMAANQTFLAVVLCAIAVGAAWELCERLGCSERTSLWLCAFFLAGTSLAWCSMLGDVWFVAQSSAVCLMTLALAELAGKNRTWLVMLLYAAAIASRFTVVMALPVIAYLTASGGLRASLPARATVHELGRRGAAMAVVLVPAALLWVTYNLVRWGVPWDSGHTIFFHEDSVGSATGSPFSLANVPYQLWSLFVQYPDFSGTFPWIRPSFSGVALTWTSPALILAFFTRRPLHVVTALWVATLLAAGPNLLYYVNGYAQYGMRHALDFMPFLFVLMIFAARQRLARWAEILIAYSCIASTYGVWYWNAIVRNGGN